MPGTTKTGYHLIDLCALFDTLIADQKTIKLKKHPRHLLGMEEWRVLIKENHNGYIGWDEYTKNQEVMRENSSSKFSRGAVLKGKGLLAGLLRCKRCGGLCQFGKKVE